MGLEFNKSTFKKEYMIKSELIEYLTIFMNALVFLDRIIALASQKKKKKSLSFRDRYTWQ